MSWTQIIALGFAVGVTAWTAVFLRVTKLGTAMRSLANDREITATLGVPVRRVEASAWFVSGLICGTVGLLLPSLLYSLDAVALTFFVISALAAALIGRLQSLWVTLFGGARDRDRRVLPVGVRIVAYAGPAALAVPRDDAVRARNRRAPLARTTSRVSVARAGH